MDTIMQQMISSYNAQSLYEKKNAMKEVVQEIILCGLSRAGFFNKAAFYGGTALRIFYGLNRFSEDLDFSLMAPDANFDLSAYFPVLEKEAQAFGLCVQIEKKQKSMQSNIHSAFLKGNTYEHFLIFYADDTMSKNILKNETIKIKFEIDINPPPYASFAQKYRLQPAPYDITLYDEPSLFAGKLHAVIGRTWKNRVKGRDLYDYVFYLSRGVPVNLAHLQARLIQSGHIDPNSDCSLAAIQQLLAQRFEAIDFQQAKNDVIPFIANDSACNLWGTEFFKAITQNLTAI